MVDVVVIGAGPAGSAAAIRLARMGKRVRLYDKSKFPRAKLCGGFLSPECLEDLDDLNVLDALKRAGATPVRRIIVAPMHGNLIESAFPESGLSSSREILDQLLLDEAHRAGVDVRLESDGFDDNDDRQYTVVATGRTQSIPSGKSYIGVQAYFEGMQGISDQVELDFVESGYVGHIRQQGGVNVCALTTPEEVRRHGPSLDQLLIHWAEENATLREHLKTARRVSSWKSVGPVRYGLRQLTASQTFYVGDAACVVDPFAGEGLAMGLHSARLLSKALDGSTSCPEIAYEHLCKKSFTPSLRWDAAIRLLLFTAPFRAPILRMLQWYPHGLHWLTDLTRYRTAS